MQTNTNKQSMEKLAACGERRYAANILEAHNENNEHTHTRTQRMYLHIRCTYVCMYIYMYVHTRLV